MMTEIVIIPNGILTLNESKAECPQCERKIPFDEIEEKWMKQNNPYMKIKCKCKLYIGITTDIRGDFVAFSLQTNPTRR